MKKYFSIICALAMLTAFTGCSGVPSDSVPENGVSEPESTSENTDSPSEPESAPQSPINGESADNSETDSEPTGEPTFLIGLDGQPILTSEIVVLEDTDKTAETLTPDDIGAKAYCKGFTYLKEPTGITFDSYNDPELFDDHKIFLGDRVDNTNEWKRVNIGDEICGLKVSWANVTFMVNDFGYTFPERYLDTFDTVPYCEFEGTVEIEGFLQVLPRYVNYPRDSELTYFYPCESLLPVGPDRSDEEKGYVTPLRSIAINDLLDDFGTYGEHDGICFGVMSEQTCDMDGIGRGDIAYVRAILGNISLNGNHISATLENVERLSDILMHIEDHTEVRQPAPTR